MRPIIRKSLSKFENIAAILTLCIVIIIIIIVISPTLYFGKIHYSTDTPMNETIYAPFTFTVVDKEATERIKNQVAEKIKRIYQYDFSVEPKILEKVDKLFEIVQKAQQDKTVNTEDKIVSIRSNVRNELGFDISNNTIKNILLRSEWMRFQKDVKNIIHYMMSNRGIIADKNRFIGLANANKVDLSIKSEYTAPPRVEFSPNTLIDYPSEISPFLYKILSERYYKPDSQWNIDTIRTIIEISQKTIIPNIEYLEKETEDARIAALKNVPDVITIYRKGTTIANSGEMLTYQQEIALDTLKNKIRNYNILSLLYTAVFVGIFAFFIMFYIKRFELELNFTSPNIILVSLPIILALIIGRFFLFFFPVEFSSFLFPAGLIGMLGVILLSPRLALILATCGSFLFGFSTGMNFKAIIVAFTGGFTAVTILYSIKQRIDVLKAGLLVGIINFFSILSINFIEAPAYLNYGFAAWGVINGLLCYLFTISSLPLFEYMFGVTTDIRLLELTGINHPLLQEFEEKAPGSYQHSLNVSKLAESAAIAIGANYLLTRAGAYYHDIGKIPKSKYFTENQITQEDKMLHYKLSPNMSTLIIKKHVKDGIALGKRYHLPHRVIDFIPQHHGTSLIKYFYQMAVEQSIHTKTTELIKDEDYRYAGPKPQYLETAIVMLADSVEATATSVLNKSYITEEDIRLVVHNAIADKFNDGQLDECNLTMRQLHIINESFVSTLRSRFHQRIPYPIREKAATLADTLEEKVEKFETKGI